VVGLSAVPCFAATLPIVFSSYTASQDEQGHFVLLRLVGAMRDMARKIRGVERLEFLYGVLRGRSMAVRPGLRNIG
jgi:hypothetical protein